MAILRIDKILSNLGEATRSQVKEMVKRGRIAVDGVPVSSADAKYDPEQVKITVDGAEIHYQEFCYIMMNKPAGVLSATEDKREKTVSDLLTGRYKRLNLFPAGRLDKDAEGLLLLTNDGAFCHNIISPGKHVPKVYYIETDGELTDADSAAFAEGICLADGTQLQPGKLEILESGERSRGLVTVYEGKFHQVKRMVASQGKQVTYLKRISIGDLRLDEKLAFGDFRELTAEEKWKIFQNFS